MICWPIGLILTLYSDQRVIHPIYFGFAIYIVASGCFFYTFCWAISTMLKIVRLSCPVDLPRWRSFFYLLCDLVEQTNKCFGPILLSSLLFLFIWTINGSFYIMVNLREHKRDQSILLFLVLEMTTIFLFFLLIYASHRIRKEVFYSLKAQIYIKSCSIACIV